jgi:hypothetical protein
VKRTVDVDIGVPEGSSVAGGVDPGFNRGGELDKIILSV